MVWHGAWTRRIILSIASSLAAYFTIGATIAIPVAHAADGDVKWIWTPSQPVDKHAPEGICYFRKSIPMGQPESGEIQITCDDAYELFVNSRKVGEGDNWRRLNSFDITKYLTPGRNTIAVKVTNKELGSAGLAARIVAKDVGGTHVAYSSDKSWRTSVQEFPQWTKHYFNDSQWLPAREIGPMGSTAPWLDEVQSAEGAPAGRFQTNQEFRVETVVSPADTGSLLAMTFNEFGEIYASREGDGGGILLIRDSDRDGTPDQAEQFGDQVKDVQGLLALNGQVFAVGKGSDGLGLYRLSDADSDGKADQVETLLKFTGEAAEHGPHAVTLGPDGLLYVMAGNHTQVDRSPTATSPKATDGTHTETDPASDVKTTELAEISVDSEDRESSGARDTSPLHHWYEGDLLTPKYEDPRGHAAGIKAPGGTVVRMNASGSFVELFAGGFRNAYDIAFNREGELFTYDSDMEWDVGLPWYRPTRAIHIVAGGEYGWRSGWSTWPEYFYDSLPSLAQTGRGSPTAVTVYDHLMFPIRYHDAVFVGDWAAGRIIALKVKSERGSYTADVETFATGKPLNVTDMEVGPDGGLYFCTGGRGTEGGIFRIVWKGKVPAAVTDLGQGIQQALRQPQLHSAYARQKIAAIKQKIGNTWDTELPRIASNGANRSTDRCRAIELMHLFGPFPDGEFLAKLGGDADAEVRSTAAYLMGIHPNDATRQKLTEMLADHNPRVQRVACEALVRAHQQPSIQELLPLLGSSHRHVAYAATRLLESLPADGYREAILNEQNQRAFLQGALALTTVDADRETCLAILNRCSSLMNGFIADPEFLDMLRLMQLALLRGQLKAEDVPELSTKIAIEYPTQNPLMNRELIRLVVSLQGNSAATRMMEQLSSDLPQEDKIQIALYARFMKGWTTTQKLELLKFYETARTLPGGHSFSGYIDNISRDFFVELNEEERGMVLADGAKWPSSALAVIAGLPPKLPPQTIQQIINLDHQMAGDDREAAKRLGIGVAAVLARSADPEAMAYLRQVYEKYPDRRNHIAISLTQTPVPDNWELLVRSLPILEGPLSQQVLLTLSRMEQKPDKAEPYRQAILGGLKLGDEGGQAAVKVLEKWSGKKFGEPGDQAASVLAAWQKWFVETYPNEPEPSLPVETSENRWTYDELMAYLGGPEASVGNSEIGEQVFAKAQCIQCHRYGQRGEGIGPELTTVSQRFQRKEILESILFPSQVISDQYASKTVQTTDGRVMTGLVSPQADGSMIILSSNGQKTTIKNNEVESISPSKKSAMPDGLLNHLTLEEIAHLFSYLNQPPNSHLTSRRGNSRQ
ncbi:MAG: HEAT repeat domain-containing protein [Pirellulales bacterium]|nr:HEAT repeat domain-containing protein [Pirellulales bacterium]